MPDPVAFAEEQWDPRDPETFLGLCRRCGEERPLQSVCDPFAVEGINDEDPEERHAWCYPCYDTRLGDV